MSTWIRRRSVTDLWHLKADPAPRAAAEGATVASCGRIFSGPQDFQIWRETGDPPGPERCNTCQGAFVDERTRYSYKAG